MQTETRRGVLGILAGVVAGLAVGFALGALIGWPPTEDPGGRDRAVARMCTALGDVDAESWQRMQQDGLALSSSGEDHMMVASLMAAVGYAEAAARTEEGSDELLATAGELRTAMEQLQLDVARDRADALQEHC